MADSLTPERRSWNMSRIRGKDTKPERIVRSLLHRLGYRFTVNGPKNKQLPGKPDIVLPKYQTVIFVHGCFWHGHQGCKNFRLPKTRTRWWRDKIARTQERDKQSARKLRGQGWHVLTVWECRLATEAKIERVAATLLKRLEG